MKRVLLIMVLFFSGCSYMEQLNNPDTPLYRIALIIANEKYEPFNRNVATFYGANALYVHLDKIGFDNVLSIKKNLTYSDLKKSFLELESIIVDKKHTVLFIYFAGHGVMVKGHKDAYIEMIGKNEKTLVNINVFNDFIEKLDIKATVVSLDACRDIDASKSKKIEGEIKYFPKNIYFHYATRDTKTAIAAKDKAMTPYTKLLLHHLNRKVRVDDMFSAIQEDLEESTDGRQIAQFAGTLNPSFYFYKDIKSGLSSYN